MSTMLAQAPPGAANGTSTEWAGHVRSGPAVRGDKAVASLQFVLLLRAALVNGLAAAVMAVGWHQGLLGPILAADTTRISHLIVAVFTVGLATCLRRIAQLSRELNAVKAPHPSPATRTGRYLRQARNADAAGRAAMAGALRLKLSSRIAGVRQFANNLVLLGLVGTVVGFIMALSGVDPASATDAAAVAPMIAGLIEGMGVALYTTLVGSVLNIWLMLNCRLLETASVSLATQLVERTEG